MPRHFFLLALALCAPATLLAAPAPALQLVTAEAVVAYFKGNPREIAARLASPATLRNAVQSQGAGILLAGEKDPAAWLASRLRTTVDERQGSITILLSDCPKKDAVKLLSAVVAAYKANIRDQNSGTVEDRQRLERAVFVRRIMLAQAAQGGAVIALSDSEAVNANPNHAMMEKVVLQAPRIVPAPVFGGRRR